MDHIDADLHRVLDVAMVPAGNPVVQPPNEIGTQGHLSQVDLQPDQPVACLEDAGRLEEDGPPSTSLVVFDLTPDLTVKRLAVWVGEGRIHRLLQRQPVPMGVPAVWRFHHDRAGPVCAVGEQAL